MTGFFAKQAMRLSFMLRWHPFRMVYHDKLLGYFADECETPYFMKDWGKCVIYDVGASVGKYTVMLAKNSPNATVYAFEPNLNSLYYLGYRVAKYPNIVIVPNALTANGASIRGSYNPDFTAPPTGPATASISLREALNKFGAPAFVKMDIEGGEYDIFESDPNFPRTSTILVSWHFKGTTPRVVPIIHGWRNTSIAEDITILEPM